MKMPTSFQWSRRHNTGYEVSSKGDRRFSAFNAMMPDDRSIEQWYQCDIKGYQPGGHDWRLGKGKGPLFVYPAELLYEYYLSIWRLWAIRHTVEMQQLQEAALRHGNMLTDCFATTPINQARALAQILNEWTQGA